VSRLIRRESIRGKGRWHTRKDLREGRL